MRAVTNAQTTRRDLTAAMTDRRAVTIGYRKPTGEESRRTVEIAEIRDTKAGDVVMIAWDRSVSQRRTFRLDRITGYTLHRTAKVAAYRQPVAPEPTPEATAAPVVVRPGDEVRTADGLVGRVQGKPMRAEWGVLAVVKFVAAEQPATPRAEVATRRCECSEYRIAKTGATTGCTATTKNRFAPGHDAKLKGFLARAGADGLLVTRGDADTREAVDHAAGYAFGPLVVAMVARILARR